MKDKSFQVNLKVYLYKSKRKTLNLVILLRGRVKLLYSTLGDFYPKYPHMKLNIDWSLEQIVVFIVARI